MVVAATSQRVTFVLAVCLLLARHLPETGALTDADVLTDLFNATGGQTWHNRTNWTANSDPCTWEWVSCSPQGRVRKLKLEFNNLNGTVPNSIGSLDASTLTYLSVHHNALKGTLPASIASLTSLKTLYAANNAFTGNLPSAYGSLQNLGRLFVSSNQLEGTVPVCYGSLKTLYRAMFSDNEALRGSSLPSGELPPSFRSLERLVQLNGPLARNQFWPRGVPRLAATAHNNETPTYYDGACACAPICGAWCGVCCTFLMGCSCVAVPWQRSTDKQQRCGKYFFGVAVCYVPYHCGTAHRISYCHSGHQYTYQSDINAAANDHPPVYYGWDAHNGV